MCLSLVSGQIPSPPLRGKSSRHRLTELSAPLYAPCPPLCAFDQHFSAHTPRLGSYRVLLKKASACLYRLMQVLGSRSLHHLEVGDGGALSDDG